MLNGLFGESDDGNGAIYVGFANSHTDDENVLPGDIVKFGMVANLDDADAGDVKTCKCAEAWDESWIDEICDMYLPDNGAIGIDGHPICIECGHGLSCHAETE